jgi:hypothetical protein
VLSLAPLGLGFCRLGLAINGYGLTPRSLH